MESVNLRSRVGADGILHLDIPSGFSNVELEVMVILQPLISGASATAADQEWSPDFFTEVAGGWQGEPLVRESQGRYEMRNEL